MDPSLVLATMLCALVGLSLGLLGGGGSVLMVPLFVYIAKVPVNEAIAIPLGDLVSRLNEIPNSKPVVTVCHSGKRSAQATVILKKNSFNEAANLKGGMIEWVRADHASAQ